MQKTRQQLLEEIMRHMGELHRCFATNRDVFLAQFKLSRPQLELLFSLKHGAVSIGELASHFSVSSSAVSQMVDQLETKGLVKRVQSQRDKRVTHIQLAETAQKQFKAMKKQFITHISDKFENISDEEFNSLLTVLSKITQELGGASWKK